MKRSTRAELARQTLAILERGSYELPSGRAVDLTSAVNNCLEATRFFAPEDSSECAARSTRTQPVGATRRSRS